MNVIIQNNMPNTTSLNKTRIWNNKSGKEHWENINAGICKKIRHRGSTSIFKIIYVILPVILANYASRL